MSVIGLRNLCTPAMVYLVMSFVAIMFMASQQYYSNMNLLCLGSMTCDIQGGVYLVFVVKMMIVLFWTWILNIICNKVSPLVSWGLVLLPYVMWFVVLFYMFYRYK